VVSWNGFILFTEIVPPMPPIQGVQRDAVLLVPPSRDAAITDAHPVRFIDACVDQRDLQARGVRRAVAAPTGRPADHPGDRLKRSSYGDRNRRRSRRLLDRESHRNVELICLLKKLPPDGKTMAAVRKDTLQPRQKVGRAGTVRCQDLALVGGALVAIDGSTCTASPNRKRNGNAETLTRARPELANKITSYLQALEAHARHDPTPPRRTALERQARIEPLRVRQEPYQTLRAELAARGARHIALPDPDSRSMRIGQGLAGCANVHVVTAAKHKLMVATAVTNAPSASDHRAPRAIGAKEVRGGATCAAPAARGYAPGAQVNRCERAKLVADVPKPPTSRRPRKGLVPNDDFRADARDATETGPNGAGLTVRLHTPEKGRDTRY